jgi:(S)-citramalyl-CoA lyase
MNTKPVPRSMLFTPATKASYFDKAAEVGAAAVILDLEDSVPTAAKDQARSNQRSHIGGTRLLGN